MDVESLKNLGNVAFSHKKYGDAVELYSKALELDQGNAVLFSNRAMSQLKLENWDKALQDCDAGLNLNGDDKTKIKLLFRKASAFKGMKSNKLAKQYFEKVLDLDPSNQAAKNELKSITITLDNTKSHRLPIPIEKVDRLPQEYESLVYDKPISTTIPTRQEVENPSVVSQEINELFGSKPSKSDEADATPFVERSTTSPLLALKAIPGANRDRAYTYIINLPVSSLLDDFSYGIEPEFLIFYLESAAQVSSKNLIDNWDILILNNLKQLSTLKRFNITKSFINNLDLETLLKNVEQKNSQLVESYKSILL